MKSTGILGVLFFITRGWTVSIENSSCMVETSSPITIRLNMAISTSVVTRGVSIICNDDFSNNPLKLLSQDISSSLFGAKSSIVVTVAPSIMSDQSSFTCKVTSNEGTSQATCNLKVSDISSPTNLMASRLSSTSVKFIWDPPPDTFTVSHYEAIVEATNGEFLKIFTEGRDVTNLELNGLSNSIQYNAKLYAVGLASGTSVILPGPGSASVHVPSLCHPAVGQIVQVTLEPNNEDYKGFEISDLCSLVDYEMGFIREALDYVFIETQSIPEECRMVGPKILSYTCNDEENDYAITKTGKSKRKDRPKSKSNRLDRMVMIKALVTCNACQVKEDTTDSMDESEVERSRKKASKETSGRVKSELIDQKLLPEEVIVKGILFNVYVEQGEQSLLSYCGCTRVYKKDTNCECPRECPS